MAGAYLTACLTLAGGALASHAAYSAEEPEEPMVESVVTGSRLSLANASSPILVLDSEELWYAGAATLTLVCLLVAGYYLLQSQLIRGLDLLNKTQFAKILAHLGEHFAALDAHLIDVRIRETSDCSSVLFFITVDDRSGPLRPVFYSTNLCGLPIPDVPGQRVFNAQLPRVGELRVGEFILGQFDVTMATPLSRVRQTMRDYSEICIWMLSLMVASGVGVGFGLSRLALRPVRLTSDTANHISSDNLSKRIPVASVRD